MSAFQPSRCRIRKITIRYENRLFRNRDFSIQQQSTEGVVHKLVSHFRAEFHLNWTICERKYSVFIKIKQYCIIVIFIRLIKVQVQLALLCRITPFYYYKSLCYQQTVVADYQFITEK